MTLSKILVASGVLAIANAGICRSSDGAVQYSATEASCKQGGNIWSVQGACPDGFEESDQNLEDHVSDEFHHRTVPTIEECAAKCTDAAFRTNDPFQCEAFEHNPQTRFYMDCRLKRAILPGGDQLHGYGWTTCIAVDPCADVTCPAPADDCHDQGVCVAGECTNPPKADRTTCDDGDPFTGVLGEDGKDTCDAGVCIGYDLCKGATAAEDVVCPANQCQDPGTCHSGFGTCSAPTNKALGTACDDNDAATGDDQCNGAGVCAGRDLCAGKVCPAAGECRGASVCNSGTGECSAPLAAPDTTCDDGNDGTSGDVCSATGECAGIEKAVGMAAALDVLDADAAAPTYTTEERTELIDMAVASTVGAVIVIQDVEYEYVDVDLLTSGDCPGEQCAVNLQTAFEPCVATNGNVCVKTGSGIIGRPAQGPAHGPAPAPSPAHGGKGHHHGHGHGKGKGERGWWAKWWKKKRGGLFGGKGKRRRGRGRGRGGRRGRGRRGQGHRH